MRAVRKLARAVLTWFRTGYWLVADPPAPPPPPEPKATTGDDDVIMRLRLPADSVTDRRRPITRRWN
jgi:hypothetical protein